MDSKKLQLVLPGQLWMLLQCLDSVADPSALQSLPRFAGRGLVQERERCWIPPDRLQGDQEFHCEYPPCTGTPKNDQNLSGNWCKTYWVSTLYFVGLRLILCLHGIYLIGFKMTSFTYTMKPKGATKGIISQILHFNPQIRHTARQTDSSVCWVCFIMGIFQCLFNLMY